MEKIKSEFLYKGSNGEMDVRTMDKKYLVNALSHDSEIRQMQKRFGNYLGIKETEKNIKNLKNEIIRRLSN